MKNIYTSLNDCFSMRLCNRWVTSNAEIQAAMGFTQTLPPIIKMTDNE